jgi:hypothetical protein
MSSSQITAAYSGFCMTAATTTSSIATLLANQANQLMNGITESTSNFSTLAFPIIKSVMPQLIGQQLVSVQPLPLPNGKVFHMDYGVSDYYGKLEQKRKHERMKARYEKLKQQEGWPKV